jgi:hypothetical protein
MRRRRDREIERRNLGDRRRGVRVFFLLVEPALVDIPKRGLSS